MAKAKPQAAAKAKPKRKSRAKKLDTVNLEKLAGEVANNAGADVTDLMQRFEREEGMKVRKTSEGRIYVKMAGVEAVARGSEDLALTNWAAAARRAVMKAA